MAPSYVFVDYDSDGLPLDINHDHIGQTESIRQPLSSRAAAEVFYKLPNGKPLTDEHPEWLKDADVHIVDKPVQLRIVYVDEGAGYRNSIGYYVYNTDTPPQTMDEIDQIRIVFANGSGKNKGGSLVPGDALQLAYEGTVDSNSRFTPTSFDFPAGTSIGWVLMANGWTGQRVNIDVTKYFSRSSLNPEKTSDRRVHTVALQSDTMAETIIYGFEDLNRDGRTDDDFNDFVFFLQPTDLASIDPVSYSGTARMTLFGTIICNDEKQFDDIHND